MLDGRSEDDANASHAPMQMKPTMRAAVTVAIVIVAAAASAQTPGAAQARVPQPADRPAPRGDQNSMLAHTQLVEKAKQGRIDVYFIGDSIARRWGATDYPELLANW